MLDVLITNELQASDMLDIMHTILGYLGNSKKKVPSGGWSTHLWAAGNNKVSHDGNTPEERLELMVCMPKYIVYKSMYVACIYIYAYTCTDITPQDAT